MLLVALEAVMVPDGPPSASHGCERLSRLHEVSRARARERGGIADTYAQAQRAEAHALRGVANTHWHAFPLLTNVQKARWRAHPWWRAVAAPVSNMHPRASSSHAVAPQTATPQRKV
jgi:hypothetical protein